MTMDKSKSTCRAQLTRKPSLKRQPPPVKQTKGSLLRMIRANPLIAIDSKIMQEHGISEAELKQLGHIGVVQYTMSLKEKYTSEMKSETPNNENLKNVIAPSKYQDKPNANCDVSKPPCVWAPKPSKKAFSRRSASAEKFDSKKHFPKIALQNNSITQSMETLSNEAQSEKLNITPLAKEKQFTFKTPQTYRNVFIIPSTSKKFGKKSFSCSTPGDVKVKLSNWLSKRGKSLGSYHHLKCFGILQEEVEEEKENIEQLDLIRPKSYDGLDIIQEEDKPEGKNITNTINPQVLINYDDIAKDALHELLKLIQEGYSSDQCGGWLNMIKEKCQNVEEEPTYWECRAALEECYENLPNAIICYRNAIIKGAKLNKVDESLDLLLEKFSLLNINSNVNSKDTKSNPKIIMDARNVFKSTIIQFAVQERDNRKKENEQNSKQVLITPVRRSTRLSFNRQGTPGVKLCSSLKDVDDFEFRKNSFLSVRYN